MPTTQLLKKYDLMQFAEVTKSVRYDDCFIALCVITKKKKSLSKRYLFEMPEKCRGGIF